MSIPHLSSLLLLAALGTGPLAAQNDTRAQLRTEYLNNMKEVENKVVGLAEAFPADKYGWRPATGVRSVSEVLMHIAGEHYVYLPEAVGAKPPADLAMGSGQDVYVNLEKVADKAAVIGHLKASFAYQKAVLEKSDAILNTGKVLSFGEVVSVSNLFTIMVSDQHEHLGQLIAYARMNGVVPPWSKQM
jgi:uncharacterized damage-inducible protein DinB